MSQAPDRSLPVSVWLGAVLAGCSLSFMGVTVLAPRISADAGLPPEAVGLFSGVVWAAALAASLVSGAVVRQLGPWQAARGCLLICALGIAGVASGQPMLIGLGAICIGLGNGMEAPPASQLLGYHVTPTRRPFYFSLKQTGVQFGAVAASLLMPSLALLAGWRAALLAVMAVVLLLALSLGRPARQHAMAVALTSAAPQPPVRQAWWQVLRAHRDLRRLALAAAAFGATQVCLNTFFVTWMVTVREASLTAAGALVATAQGAGLLGRPFWGWVASRAGGATRVLRGLGLLMALAALLLGVFGSQLGGVALWLLAAIFGLSASGWNGVFLSEVAARASQDEIAARTAVAMVPVYLGLVMGPVVFAAIGRSLDLSAGFILVAAMAATGAWLVPSLRHE